MLHFPSPDIGMFGRRQRHVRGHRIPVAIVRENAAQDSNTALVHDTFGADDVSALPGGCPCCTVRDRLQGALRARLNERQQRPFTRIVIETQADLAPILRTFASERALAEEFYVEDAPPLAGNRFVLTESTPLPWEAFSRFMTTLQSLRGADMTHAHGLLHVAGCRGPVAVEVMGHLAARPVELQAWPDETRASRLEFVTHGIDERSVRVMFDAVRALV